jgi:NAD(P)-dependent dehydrogenase (short-subunit alcohol dehydrogenase family)
METVFITGANRGIGLALTKAFLDGDYLVIASCRVPEQAVALQALQAAKPARLHIVELDVVQPDSLTNLPAAVEKISDQIDVLINNAGVLLPSNNFSQISAASLRQSFEVNSIAPIMVWQTLLPLLQKAVLPRVVNITMPTQALSALQNRTSNHHYIASRYALNALVKMAAAELGQAGIVTIALYPGYIQTDMNQHDTKAEPAETAVSKLVPLIANLTAEHNGLCLMPDGSSFDW